MLLARIPCDSDYVANLTLTLDDRLLLRARQRALAQGTSVNAVVRDFMTSFAGEDEAAEARRALLALAEPTSF